MTVVSIVTVLETLSHHHSTLFLLVDLSFKSSLILILAYSLNLLLIKRSAYAKSMLWMMTFTSLLFLPLFHELLPAIPISLSYEDPVISSAMLTGSKILSNDLSSRTDVIASSLFGVSLSYILISLLLVSYLLSGIFKIALLSRRSIPFKHEIALQKLQHLQELNGINSRIELLMSPQIVSPLTWGVFRHKIIFPLTANGWDQELLEQAISHELGHIQRMDWLLHIVSRLAVCFYWINPLIWIAHRESLLESEKACDDAAIDDTGCEISYAQNLLKLATSFNDNDYWVAPALFSHRSSLSQRIQHILTPDQTRNCNDTTNITPTLLLAIILAAPFSTLIFNIEESDQAELYNLTIPIYFVPNDSEEFISLMREFRSFDSDPAN